jgi:hypothetical protein
MQTFAILWPAIVLAALSFVVMVWVAVARTAYMKSNPPRPDDLATGEAASRYFQPVEMPANNLRNLFEVPVLFFALIPLLLIMHQAGHVQVALAWVYVVLRVIHSIGHVVLRKVSVRAPAFWVSVLVLMAMWIGFAIDIASAQSTYDAAIDNMTI